MNFIPHRFYHHLTLIAVLILATIFVAPSITNAQDEGTPIEISGVVSQIGSGTITVAGLTVDASNTALDASITVGTTVTVTGHLLANNVVVAQVIVVITPAVTATPPLETTPEATPELTPETTPSVTPTPNPNVVIVVEGPVINIVTNIITIYDFNIEIDPANPLLNIIDIGDIIHVEGALNGSGVIVATVVSNITNITTVSNGATAGLEGPIEAINGNIVIVNGIPVQFAPDDPQLAALQVGDFLNVQGNFEGSGTTVVLVVINVVIINNVIVNGNPLCWYHVDGMGMGMGHWHCDGMGMGMGMGEPDGMGMGEPDGMGMGMGG